MKLLLIRHARAADSNGQPDAQRPLTELGRREFGLAARWVVTHGATPQHIFHSPALRTMQTAEILAAASELPSYAVDAVPWLALGTDCDQILPMLWNLPADITALVGHEPNMSGLATRLLCGERLTFRPGTIACVEFGSHEDFGHGRLLWMLDGTSLFAE